MACSSFEPSVEQKMHSETQLKPAEIRRLIAEVKSRRPLWDFKSEEYKERVHTQQLWKEVADAVGVDVEHCKRKWKNLRDAYRAEIRRYKRRADGLKAEGQEVDPKTCVSKWCYFQPMSFINESSRFRHVASAKKSSTEEPSKPCENETDFDLEKPDDMMLIASGVPQPEPYDIKLERKYSSSMESDDGFDVGSGELHPDMDFDDDLEFEFPEDEGNSVVVDDEIENDKLFEEFKSVATPQAARRLSSCISKSNAGTTSGANSNISDGTTKTSEGGDEKMKTSENCRCAQSVHFLEDLEREEKKLMQSTRHEMARSDSIKHIGDSDYNFLISFWPQMKRLSELQNLSFRARMSELMLNIMSSQSGGSHHGNTHYHGHGQSQQSQPYVQQQQQQQQQQQNNQPYIQQQDQTKPMTVGFQEQQQQQLQQQQQQQQQQFNQSMDSSYQIPMSSVVLDVATNGKTNNNISKPIIYTNNNSNNWSF